jgi:biopolymer transport protein ExbD
MAQIDTGSHGSQRRETNQELPLVPFIDFLLCLVSFLLITAVWSQNARLDASANVPGPTDCKDGPCKDEKPKRLHVEVKDRKFSLVWRQGDTVLSSTDVERHAQKSPDGSVRYPELEQRLALEWKAQGTHRDATDPKSDQAVLHTSNSAEFGEVVAVVDALSAHKRELKVGGATQRVPAFAVTFAAN